jgi:hypothetical protein
MNINEEELWLSEDGDEYLEDDVPTPTNPKHFSLSLAPEMQAGGRSLISQGAISLLML